MQDTITASLCPAQQKAYATVTENIGLTNVFVVWSSNGMGKTTILEQLHRDKGGELLRLKDYIDELRTHQPEAMDEALEHLLMRSMQRNQMVILDDLDLIYAVVCGCAYTSAYPRGKYVEAILTSVTAYAAQNDKTLVFGYTGTTSSPLNNRCVYAGFQRFEAEDYQFLCQAYLGDGAAALDYKKIYRYAPKLHAHQLKSACMTLGKSGKLTTEIFIEYLRKRKMMSNVNLEEVEAVDLHSLKGIDNLIEALEANIIVPLERDELANEFNIQPKRGVLLAGPPGTGKTTIGRALAHRLGSKFFLIDGTFISGSREFYQKIEQVFEAAKNNAPAIIFIDDSDVIFENKEDFGLYRYLLTALDGLESESNKRVCIMMTTMDVASVPAALVRSGRIELWLETTLPDASARLEILTDRCATLPAVLRGVDIKELAEQSEGLTGADLRRLIEDAKILYAYDKSRSRESGDIFSYFAKATETIRSNKEKYAAAEAKSSAKQMSANPFAFMAGLMGGGMPEPEDIPS